MRAAILALGCIVSACSVAHQGDASVDGGGDDALTDAYVDAPPDGEAVDASDVDAPDDGLLPDAGRDGGTCTAPPAPRCPGVVVPRGAPLVVTGWETDLGHGVVHDASGWRWLGRVRDTADPSRFSSFRVVRADEHFTSLDTSVVLASAPRTVAGVAFQPDELVAEPCNVGWLALFSPSDGSGARTLAAPYGLDGAALGAAVDVTPLPAAGCVAQTTAGLGFVVPGYGGTCGVDAFSTLWLAPTSLAPTRVGPTAFDGHALIGCAWAGSEWLLAARSTCDAASTLEVRALSTDAAISPARPVTGLPAGAAGAQWRLTMLVGGGAVAWRVTPGAPGEVLAVGVDTSTGALRSTPVDVGDGAGIVSVRGMIAAREGGDAYAVLFVEQLSGSPARQRTWFVRFDASGTVLGRSMLAEGAAIGGSDPFALAWLGDRYVVGYPDGGNVLDELFCRP